MFDGIFNLSIPLCPKQFNINSFKLSGNFISRKEEHPLKALHPIAFKVVGNTIFVNFLQP